MMAWTALTYTFESVLPSSKLTANQANLDELRTNAAKYLVTGGAANSYTLTYSPAFGSLGDGQDFFFKVHAANTGTSTINVNGLGDLGLKKYEAGSVVALVSGDLPENAYIHAIYRSTQDDVLILSMHGLVNSPLLSAANVFTEDQRINAAMGINTAPPASDGDFAISGTMTGGTVPLARIQRTEGSATSTGSTATLNVGTVNVGDRILISANCIFTKNGDGQASLSVEKSSGTAVILMSHNLVTCSHNGDFSNGVQYNRNLSTVARVTSSGTLLIGSIIGGALTSIATNQIHAIVLNNG